MRAKGLFALLLVFSSNIFAQENFPINLMIYDAPFNTERSSLNAPSMNQAMNSTISFYNFAHKNLYEIAIEKEHNPYLYEIFFDAIWQIMPLGTAWLHEEYHRAVLSHKNITSHNDVYYFKLSDVIAVSDIKDEELAKFKKEDPAGFVRMSSAGMESQIQMNRELNFKNFFYKAHSSRFNQLYNAVGVISYMQACINSDERVESIIDNEGSDLSKRDFTGFDCLAWSYDLHRPNEAYSERGAHPSGRGIDRYIQFADLKRTEKDYLIDNANLSFINMINPFMFGYNSFDYNEYSWNFSFSHYMTSFGHSIGLDTFIKWDKQKYQFSLHNYFNKIRTFNGVEAIIVDKKLNNFISADIRLMLWNQPKNQKFKTTNNSLGALASVRAKYHAKENSYPYIEVLAKSQGWVAGEVYLGPALNTRLGYVFNY